jgi:Ca2+/H+ antiporter
MNELDQPGVPAAADASQSVRTFIDTHGKMAVTILAGGAAATLGAIVPFAHVYRIFGGSAYYSIVQGGFYGLVLLAIPVLLGILPVFLKQHMKFKLSAFGLACAMFGIFFTSWVLSSGIAGAIGSVGGFSIGFYLTIAGYAAMVFGYYQLQNDTHC